MILESLHITQRADVCGRQKQNIKMFFVFLLIASVAGARIAKGKTHHLFEQDQIEERICRYLFSWRTGQRQLLLSRGIHQWLFHPMCESIMHNLFRKVSQSGSCEIWIVSRLHLSKWSCSNQTWWMLVDWNSRMSRSCQLIESEGLQFTNATATQIILIFTWSVNNNCIVLT